MSTSTTAIAIPTGTWSVDPSHSSVNFAVRHLGIAKVRGSFADFEGTIQSDGEAFSGSGRIQVASVDTGTPDRDAHLRSPDFFDAEVHPEIAFTVTSTTREVVRGDLTINGVTRSIELDAEIGGEADDPYGNRRTGLELAGEIRRSEFGMAFDRGNAVVGDKVKIELDLSLIRV